MAIDAVVLDYVSDVREALGYGAGTDLDVPHREIVLLISALLAMLDELQAP